MKTSENGAPILSGTGLKTVRERIAQEFERARHIERRRFGRPASTDLALYGRRKDDKPLVVDTVAERFKQMVADAAHPEVELVESEPLEQQAAGLLAAIGGSEILRKKTACHEITDVFEGDINDLFAAAEASLGFRKPDVDGPNLSAQSIWTRQIKLGKKAR